MKRRGLIQIDRGLMSHPVFQEEPFTEREAWIWMLMEASFEARRVRVLHNVISLERGQFAASLRFMAERFQWKKDRVSRFLKRIVKEGMIETATETGETVISICNYEVYQDFELYRETPDETPPRQQRDTPTTDPRQTITPYKHLTNTLEGTPPKKRKAKNGTRLEEDWRPDAADWQYATDQGLDSITAKREFEKFQNYWLSASGAKARKVDWSRTWRSWCLRATENPSSVQSTTGGAGGRKGSSVYTNLHDAAGQVVKDRATARGHF